MKRSLFAAASLILLAVSALAQTPILTVAPGAAHAPAPPVLRVAPIARAFAASDARLGGYLPPARYSLTYPAGVVPAIAAPLTSTGGTVTNQVVSRLPTGQYQVSYVPTLSPGAVKMTISDAKKGLSTSVYSTYTIDYAVVPASPFSDYGFRFQHAARGNVFVKPAAPGLIFYNEDKRAASYEARDFRGALIDKGAAPVGAYPSLPLPKLTRPGWYLVDLLAANGDCLASTAVSVVPPDDPTTNLQTLDGVLRYSTSGTHGNENEDMNCRAWASAAGPARLAIDNPASPNISAITADAQAEISLYINGRNGQATDPVNPRELYVNDQSFDANFPAQVAGLTQVAAALKNLGVRVNYAGRNEPGGNPNASFLPQVQAYYAGVKAGDPAANVLGFEAVNASSPGVESLLAAGGGAVIDGYGFHDYNSAGARTMDAMVGMLTRTGQQGKPRWMTEGGFTMAQYGVGTPWRAGSQWCEQMMLYPRYNLPPERVSYWFTRAFYTFQTYLENQDGSYNPQALWFRRQATECWGTKFASAYTFGAGGSALWTGNRYDAPAGSAKAGQSVSVFFGNGARGGVLRLTVTGASVPSSLVGADAWGNTATLPIIGGVATLPPGDGLIYYVRHATALTLTPLGTDYGVNLAAAGTITTPTNQDHAATLLNGSRALWSSDSQFFNRGGRTDSFLAGDTVYPYTLTVTLPSAATVHHLIVTTARPYQSQCGIIRASVYTSASLTGALVYQGDISQPAQGLERFRNQGTFATHYTDQYPLDCAFDVPLTGTAQRVMLRVWETTPGGQGDMTAALYGGQPSVDVTQRKSVTAVSATGLEVY